MKPRRQQTPITIRSDRAAARLALFTRDGRSQAEVIETALERLPAPATAGEEREQFLKEFDALARKAAAEPRKWKSMAEFDEATYDERGLLR